MLNTSLNFPTLIYLNGPSTSGKTTLADKLISLDEKSILQYHFATPLWTVCDTLLEHRLSINTGADAPLDFNSQEVKESRPFASALKTWREILIDLGNVTRNAFGSDYFSHAAAIATETMLLNGIETIIFPTTRTLDDLSELVKLVPKRNQLLIRIERDGTSFENDIGNYLYPEIPSITMENNGTLDEFYTSVISYLTGE